MLNSAAGIYVQMSPTVKPSVKGSSLSNTIVFSPKIQLVPESVGTTAGPSPICAWSTRRLVDSVAGDVKNSSGHDAHWGAAVRIDSLACSFEGHAFASSNFHEVELLG